MKHLKTYPIFESEFKGLTRPQTFFLDRKVKGTWRVNPSTGLVDVDGDFYVISHFLEKYGGIKFGTVTEDFRISGADLKTLEGAPKEVGGDFNCRGNQIQSLEGGPRKVGGHFNCSKNHLQNLKGSPQKIGGHFDCSENALRSLEGGPQEVVGNFDCSRNVLLSLEGAPQSVGGFFFVNGIINVENWSLQTALDLYSNVEGEVKKLLGTLVSPEAVQKAIDENPERAAVYYRSIIKNPKYKDLKWPESLKNEVGLLGDLSDIGL